MARVGGILPSSALLKHMGEGIEASPAGGFFFGFYVRFVICGHVNKRVPM